MRHDHDSFLLEWSSSRYNSNGPYAYDPTAGQPMGIESRRRGPPRATREFWSKTLALPSKPSTTVVPLACSATAATAEAPVNLPSEGQWYVCTRSESNEDTDWAGGQASREKAPTPLDARAQGEAGSSAVCAL